MKILFIAGGEWQVPLVRFLKNKSCHLTIVDPYSKSPAVQYADEFIKCDVKDVDQIYSKVKNRKFNLVLSDQTDVSVKTVSELSFRLNLSGNSIDITEKYSNKYESRMFLKNTGLSHCPEFEQVLSVEELKLFLAKNDEAIIKPFDAQSSRGVYRVSSELSTNELETYFKDTILASPSSKVLVEQFIKGREITVEGLCINGKHYSLTSSSKSHFKTGIANNLEYPSGVNEELLKCVFQFNDEYVKKTGLYTGITHAEYIIDEEKNDFWLVEIACRGGGTLIPSDIVPWVTGVDVYEMFYSALLDPTSKQLVRKLDNERSALLHFFNFKSKKVKTIKGVDEINALDDVLMFRLSFQEGDVLWEVNDDRGRHGFVILLSHSKEVMECSLNNIYDILEIDYEI